MIRKLFFLSIFLFLTTTAQALTFEVIDDVKMGKARTIARDVIKHNARSTFLNQQLGHGVSYDAENTQLKGKNIDLHASLVTEVEGREFTETLNRIIVFQLKGLGEHMTHAYSYYLNKKPNSWERQSDLRSFQDLMSEANLKLEELVWILEE